MYKSLFLSRSMHVPNRHNRGLGWRIHGSVEDNKLSTNKQHSLSSTRDGPRVGPRVGGHSPEHTLFCKLSIASHPLLLLYQLISYSYTGEKSQKSVQSLSKLLRSQWVHLRNTSSWPVRSGGGGTVGTSRGVHREDVCGAFPPDACVFQIALGDATSQLPLSIVDGAL